MAGQFTRLINKLCKGLYYKHKQVYYVDTQQFWSHSQERAITMFILSEQVHNERTGAYTKRQIIKSASQLDIVTYLAAKMKELNGEVEEDERKDEGESESALEIIPRNRDV